MKLFVGLGNPGEKYARNRHNIGFMAVERIAERHRFGAWKKKFSGFASDGDVAGEKVLLLKPDTYMNESGRAVGEAARFLKIGLGDIIVFHDELDLEPGRVKVKTGGGNAGHNGLRSISAHLGNDFVRVRFGIGHPGVKELVHAWVLNDFAKADRSWLEPLLDGVADCAPRLAAGDSARFLSDLARVLGSDRVGLTPISGGAVQDGVRPAGSDPGKPRKTAPASGHPAGERIAKRQSALADKLKKWLAIGKKPPASDAE